jgi:glycosyltransferase involved in cell wall biosynthesis
MKISIITVCYNSEKYICTAIESVLSQTCKNIEYIIVDGNSTDNTLDIVKSYEPQFGGRMRWISEPDAGLYDAMNKGIRMAAGDYVAILNVDDFYNYSGSIETVVNHLRETGADMCFSEHIDAMVANERTGIQGARRDHDRQRTYRRRTGTVRYHRGLRTEVSFKNENGHPASQCNEADSR